MNKYITALLVVLAATGVEAQSYQSALKIALGDVNIEDLCHKQAFKGVEQEICQFLKPLSRLKKTKKQSQHKAKAVFVTDFIRQLFQ